MSVATYRSVDQRANHLMPTQYRIELSGDVHHSTTSKHKVRQLENEIKRHADVDAFRNIQVEVLQSLIRRVHL